MTDLSNRPESWSVSMPEALPQVMRYTVISAEGVVSFVAAVGSLKPLIAACSHSPESLSELLRALALYDDQLAEEIASGLAIFDEHVTEDVPERASIFFEGRPDHATGVFRVVDTASETVSRKAVRGGLVLFNLKARRIVQVHNNLLRVRRRDRGRIRQGGKPVDGELYSYELPDDWALVP